MVERLPFCERVDDDDCGIEEVDGDASSEVSSWMVGGCQGRWVWNEGVAGN